jgi:pimeloyl-ACP methyl ester carboxylesterase
MLVTVLITACSGSSLAMGRGRIPPVTHASRQPAWNLCGDRFECRKLAVPLDYSNPKGRQISLAIIRAPATDPKRRIGSVLMSPGGPGESGVQFLRHNADLLGHLNQRLDLVSWDPRGVGESTPFTCLDGLHLDAYLAIDAVLDDPQEKADFIQANRDFAAGCKRRSGYLLAFMDSETMARDLDSVREAVGDRKLTYLGFSYGTFVGAWYAHLFPTRVRALAFDGVVDPDATGGADPIGQVEGFQSNLDAFFADCKSRSSCAYGRSGDPQQKLAAAVARLDVAPLPVGSRQLTRSLALYGVSGALYDESSWPDLDDALTALDGGDGSKLLDLADFENERNPDGTYSNLVNGAALATNCLDSEVPADIAEYDRLGPELARASPLFGPWSQYEALQCAYWPVGPKNQAVRLTISGTPPILLVGGTNDPATPYADAVAASKEIPNSVLLTREGNGHTSYFSSTCAQYTEDRYLVDLAVPSENTVCKS